MKPFKDFAVTTLPGELTAGRALGKLKREHADFGIVTTRAGAHAIVSAAQLRAYADAESPAVTIGVMTRKKQSGIVALDWAPAKLKPAHWAALEATVNLAKAPGVIVEIGTANAGLIDRQTIARMAGTKRLSARKMGYGGGGGVAAGSGSGGGGGGPRAYVCRLCAPPTFRVPNGGDPPLCKFHPGEHGEMVPV